MNKAKGYLLLILMGITLYSWAVEPEVTELQPWHNKTTTAASQQNGPANLTLQLLQQVRGLQQQVQQLQGRVDEQAYQLKQLQQRQQTALQDIYQQLPGATSQPDDNSPAITINASPAADLTKPSITGSTDNSTRSPNRAQLMQPQKGEQQAYDQAFKLIQTNYHQAIQAFLDFLAKYPNGAYAANAQYWLGELYLATPDLAKAQQRFATVVKDYPASNKRPDALYKLGVTYTRMKKTDQAKASLQQLITEYPNSSAAKLAKEFLKTL